MKDDAVRFLPSQSGLSGIAPCNPDIPDCVMVIMRSLSLSLFKYDAIRNVRICQECQENGMTRKERAKLHRDKVANFASELAATTAHLSNKQAFATASEQVKFVGLPKHLQPVAVTQFWGLRLTTAPLSEIPHAR